MEKIYLKNVDTGVVKTLEEWKEDAIRFFTEKYDEDEELQEDFKTVNEYLRWADERGYFYTDLVEYDENENPIEN